MTMYEAEKYGPPTQGSFNALFAALYAPVGCYCGNYHYGRKGRDRRCAFPEHEWIRVDAPDLRIVSDELSAAAHARMAGTRDAYMRATKDRPRGGRSRSTCRPGSRPAPTAAGA